MALPYSKIDQLLQLFSSSEDEELDAINDENEDHDEESKIRNDSDDDGNIKQKGNMMKVFKNKTVKEYKSAGNSDVTNDIKVVNLKVKPIMIEDSDSEFEHSNIKVRNSFECTVNNSNWSEIAGARTSKKIRKLRRRKSRQKIENHVNSEEGGENKNIDDEENIQVQIEKQNNINFKTTRTRKNRAQVKRNLRCKECNQRMKNEQLFMLHMQIHNGRNETECVLCSKNFENTNAVLEHYGSFDKDKEDEHYIKLRPFPCHLCDLRYKNRKHLTDHLDIHAGQGKYLCPICGKRFFKGFNMTIHLKVHEKAYHSCERCNKNFRNIREYQAHQRNVHGENNITCPICDRPFSRRNNMKKHMETHGRVYNQCILCNTNFEFRRDFNQHMREVHNRVKKYTCSICGKVFLLHCKLTRHIETHNRIKDNCSLCDKEFRNRRDYNAHMRNMHGVLIDLPKKELKNDSSCKMQFKIIHDVQVSQSIGADNDKVNENDVKINIKIDINDPNENYGGYYF